MEEDRRAPGKNNKLQEEDKQRSHPYLGERESKEEKTPTTPEGK